MERQNLHVVHVRVCLIFLEFNMIEDGDIDSYIKSVFAEVDAESRHRVFMILICSCLRVAQTPLPKIALDAYKVAELYWLGRQGESGDLDAA